MAPHTPSRNKKIIRSNAGTLLVLISLLILSSCAGNVQEARVEEIAFTSQTFKIVGDLRLPEGRSPFPVVVFVHGDGPNNRTSGSTYPPIMARMENAGFATFAWDKPGSGESTGEIDRSRLGEQRAQIVLDAVEVLKSHPEVDPGKIGLWGISQAGYVIPRVLTMSEDIAFVIAVSCPGAAGVDQGAYLVSAQAACAGVSGEDTAQIRQLLADIERVETYEAYVEHKTWLDAIPGMDRYAVFGYRMGVRPEEEWHAPNLEGEYFWDPIEVIERTTLPVLAFFGGMDTQVDPIQGAQAYSDALARAGNPNYRVELIPGVDHNLILSETGCLDERENRSWAEWTNYAPEYLDILEQWLRELFR